MTNEEAAEAFTSQVAEAARCGRVRFAMARNAVHEVEVDGVVVSVPGDITYTVIVKRDPTDFEALLERARR